MNMDEILAKVRSGELSDDEAKKLLAQHDAGQKRGLYCKVSPKGAVSVYGLQRMPVTLYAEQWERLLQFGDTIREFIVANDSQLNRKDRAAAGAAME
jgi:hypothetical protein